jgi:conjugative relaxase-like TrwC/TraI family protein
VLTISKARDAGAARHYYKRDDYHSERGRITGEWFGKGAAELGLEGNVLQRDFESVLSGKDPHDHSRLVEAARANGKHRGGFDATFSAPKSISLQALIGDDYRLFDAHRHAVHAGLAAMEEHVETRNRGKRETSGNMVAATFEHYSSRAGDPQLHTHAFVMNMTQRDDGQWRAIEPRTLFQAQHLGTEVYRDTLAKEVQQLGYEISERGEHGAFELAGYSRETIMSFSQRREQIEQDLADNHIGRGARAQQLAAYRTRAEKSYANAQELKAQWRARAHGMGLDVASMTTAARVRQQEHQQEHHQEPRREHQQQREQTHDRQSINAAVSHGRDKGEWRAQRVPAVRVKIRQKEHEHDDEWER